MVTGRGGKGELPASGLGFDAGPLSQQHLQTLQKGACRFWWCELVRRSSPMFCGDAAFLFQGPYAKPKRMWRKATRPVPGRSRHSVLLWSRSLVQLKPNLLIMVSNRDQIKQPCVRSSSLSLQNPKSHTHGPSSEACQRPGPGRSAAQSLP